MTRTLVLGMSVCLATSAMAGEVQWGVNGHPITAYPGVSLDDQLELVSDLGMASYRVNISFANQATALAPLVQAAKERGIVVLPVLTPGEIDLPNDSAAVLYEKAYRFAVALSSRFKDDIPVWELGNEMENHAILQPCEQRDDGTVYPCDWGPAGGLDPLDYHGERWEKVSAVLRGLSDGITMVDPGLRKAIGTAGWGHVGAFERMREDGVAWDISVWHLYGQDPEWAFQILDDYGLPIWVTELNHPYGSRDGEDAQAEGLGRIMTRLAELSDTYLVEAAHVYQLLDEPYWAPSFEAVMGLVTLENSSDGSWTPAEPKPAYAVVRDIAARFAPLRACSLDDAAAIETVLERQSVYAHCLVLGRLAEPSEIEVWSAALESGEASASDLVASLVGSPEFRTGHAPEVLDDVEYIAQVYRLMLNRDVDGYGLDSYASQIADGSLSRESLAFAITGSDEFAAQHALLFEPEDKAAGGPTTSRVCDVQKAATASPPADSAVAYAHCLLLGRAADDAELARWARDITSGATAMEDLLAAIHQSTEFAARYQTTSLTDWDYVGLIYRLMLGREPDAAGQAAYAAQLADGTQTRMSVTTEIMRSEEFVSLHPVLSDTVEQGAAYQPRGRECDLDTAAGIRATGERHAAYAYCLIIGRDGDADMVRQWADDLETGRLSLENLMVELVLSDGFADRYGPDALADRDYIRLVFDVLLMREVDGLSLEDYAAQIAGGAISRENVALGALTSSEFVARHAALAE